MQRQEERARVEHELLDADARASPGARTLRRETRRGGLLFDRGLLGERAAGYRMRMKTKTLALAVLVSCGACVGAWVVPRPSSSSPPHAPAPGAKPTHVVSVRAKALRVEGERVIFAPEEEGERATRVRYIFARAELLKAAGALRDVVLRIEQVRSQTRWLVPPTPGAGPTSGVRAIEIECRIVGVE